MTIDCEQGSEVGVWQMQEKMISEKHDFRVNCSRKEVANENKISFE